MNNYPEFLRYLNQRARFGIKFGLDNVSFILKRLARPQERLRCVHIAGTNGKGSVAAMLSSILIESGIKVGLYTSPHLIDVRERIKINNRNISEEEILDIVQKIIPYVPAHTTYFELLTVIAIEYFAVNNVDIAVVETGMGGRLDATNVCNAEVAVITDISLEHMQYLGSTIEEITYEKTAIIKPGACAVFADGLEEGADYRIDSFNLEYQIIQAGKYKNIRLGLLGQHQARNCALALKAIDCLINKGYNIPIDAVYRGLADVSWPGRFQIIMSRPLIIIDGAHNPGSALALRRTTEIYLKGKRITLIFGVLKDKDYNKIADILFPIAKRIITVTPDTKRALPGDNIISDRPITYIQKLTDAMEEAERSADYDSAILVTGSLYLVGEAFSNLVKRDV